MKSPIFLTGPGRSGTTLTNYMLSLHPDVVSLNSWYAKTRKPVFNMLGERIRRVKILEKKIGKSKGFPRANEPLQLWRDSFHNFWDAVNYGEPLDTNEKARFEKSFTRIMSFESGEKALMTKMTGPPFNKVIRYIFPSAKIVWVDRDPRAVVLSYIKMGWIGVQRFSDDEVALMSKEELIEHSCARYNHYYKLRKQQEFDHVLFYEDLIEDKLGAMAKLVSAVGLPSRSSHLAQIEEIVTYANRNSNYDLSTSQHDLMTELLSSPLKERGLI